MKKLTQKQIKDCAGKHKQGYGWVVWHRTPNNPIANEYGPMDYWKACASVREHRLFVEKYCQPED